MDIEKSAKCVVAEQICELLIGGAIGIGVSKTVMPKCNIAEKVVVTLGSALVTYMIGNAFGKKFYKFCDTTFDTEFGDL